MGIFSSMFGKRESAEEKSARLELSREERTQKYLAGVSLEQIASEYDISLRLVAAQLRSRGILKEIVPVDQKIKVLAAAIGSRNDLKAHLVSTDGEYALGLTTTGLEIFRPDGDEAKLTTVSSGDIVSTELLIDEKSVMTTTSSTRVGSAIVGGLLLGGVGAIVGGLAGRETKAEVKTINSATLKISLNDLTAPSIRVHLLKSPIAANSSDFRALEVTAQNWIDWLMVLMQRSAQPKSEKPELGVRKSPKRKPSHGAIGADIAAGSISIADELLKLAQLKSMGAITQAEFDTMKSRLMEGQSS